MFDWYWHLRLWHWWNFIIKKDEFSPQLGYWEMRARYKHLSYYSVDSMNQAISRQRHIAHLLDSGKNITDIPAHYINWSWI